MCSSDHPHFYYSLERGIDQAGLGIALHINANEKDVDDKGWVLGITEPSNSVESRGTGTGETRRLSRAERARFHG